MVLTYPGASGAPGKGDRGFGHRLGLLRLHIVPGERVVRAVDLAQLSVGLPGGDCVASGTAATADGRKPLVDVLSHDNWTGLATALPADAATADRDAYIWGMNCPLTTFWAAVGNYVATGDSYQGMLLASG
jgi:hypothetical protein